MATIDELTAIDTLSAGDQLPIYSNANGDTRRTSMTAVTTYLQSALSFASTTIANQFASPLTGTTVVVTTANSWLVLTPAGTIAALTLTLPTDRIDGEEVIVNSTQIITALTVGGAGTTVVGAPTTLATVNSFFRMRYNNTLAAWYRIG